MANEAQVTASLRINVGGLLYQSLPNSFSANVLLANGPTPGAVLVATGAGTDVDLSRLTAFGGLGRLYNIGAFRVDYGIRDTATNEFYPLGSILPGESWPLRTSPDLQKEELGTGTAAGSAKLHMKAYGGASVVIAEFFDP